MLIERSSNFFLDYCGYSVVNKNIATTTLLDFIERSAQMKKITVDSEVLEMLGKIAKPFTETTPNHVIRRLLGLPPKEPDRSTSLNVTIDTSSVLTESISNVYSGKYSLSVNLASVCPAIFNLNKATPFVNPAFLTFLMDKMLNTTGNFVTRHVLPFMDRVRLVTPSGSCWNPWMNYPYGSKNKGKNKDNGKTSCQRCVEHFKQCRKFGCWGGQDLKRNCKQVHSCVYHPDNPTEEIGQPNRCDFSKEVIWKRSGKGEIFAYSIYYLEVVKNSLLAGKSVPLHLLLAVFYSGEEFNHKLASKFQKDFHFSDEEMSYLFT